MKRQLLTALCFLPSFLTAQEVQSPDGLLKVNLQLEKGTPDYSVTYNNKICLL